MYQSYLIGSIVLNVLLLVTVVFRPDVRYPVYSCQNVLETREEKSYLHQDVSCNCTVATDDSVPILEKCSEWALLLDELERSYPSSIFDKEIPLTLEKFYAFAHRVFFAHGWELCQAGTIYMKNLRDGTRPEASQIERMLKLVSCAPGISTTFLWVKSYRSTHKTYG